MGTACLPESRFGHLFTMKLLKGFPLILAVVWLLGGCSTDEPPPPASACGAPAALLQKAMGDHSYTQGQWSGTWPVGPDNKNGQVTCSVRVEDDLNLTISSRLVDSGQVNERAEIIADFDRHLNVDGLPVAYTEDERSFQAQAACGMILTLIEGPAPVGVGQPDREALVRDMVARAGCERLPDVPVVPPPLETLAK